MSERELTPAEALSQLNKVINELGLNAVTRYTSRNRLVATAELFDKNNNLIESGAGKGPDSLIGALAESIEHYSTFQPHIGDLHHHRCDFIATQKHSECEGLLSSLPRTGEKIECFKLTTLDKREELYIPSILLCPKNAERFSTNRSPDVQYLARYSSNSGIAFGCTEAEALLHGTNEVIERHILSCFFMAVCSIGPAMDLYTPSEKLLTSALQDNPSAIESANKLQIIIIKDMLGVYFTVAFPKAGPGDLHISPIGSGCSLDIRTAIQRATTEQFQSHSLYGIAEEAIDKTTLDLLSSSDKLKGLIGFAHIRSLSLPSLDQPLTDFTASVPQQLKTLQNNLLREGKTIFHRTVARYSGNNVVSQCYVPGLERFNIIRNGCLVAPQHILRKTSKSLHLEQQK